ncbi:MAG: ATP-binding cassette domain-containing protein, partial [Solirubrobacteraceae bacterium]
MGIFDRSDKDRPSTPAVPPPPSAPLRAEELEAAPSPRAQVTSEPGDREHEPDGGRGGPPDLADHDPSGDSYNSNKIPGAAAREKYAQSLVPPGGNSQDEYRWHTGRIRETGSEDAVEFVEVHKAFGRNKILRGLNMGIPENKISMILGPSGTGKSVCIKHMVGLLYPDEGDVLV